MSGLSNESLNEMTDDEVMEYYIIIEEIKEAQQKAAEGKQSGKRTG